MKTLTIVLVTAFLMLMVSCSYTSDECKYLKAVKQKQASFLKNTNIEKLKTDLGQCSQSVFIIDENCKNNLLESFAKQHKCQ